MEISFALDLSLRMSIRDMAIGGQKVDRLTVAKKVTRDFIRGRRTDHIGFVVFSGRPCLALPLTLDQDWLMTTPDRIGFNQTNDMGTAISPPPSTTPAAKWSSHGTRKILPV